MKKLNAKHLGSDFEDYLKEEGIYEEINAEAVKRVVAWQIKEQMKLQHITKTKMATKMNTSRSALDRLLDDNDPSLTLSSLVSAARALGKNLEIKFV